MGPFWPERSKSVRSSTRQRLPQQRHQLVSLDPFPLAAFDFARSALGAGHPRAVLEQLHYNLVSKKGREDAWHY